MFTNICNYKKINKIGNKNMRNIKNGVKLTDAFYYKFLYSKLKSTNKK